MSPEIRIGRVARAAGISRDQARRAIAVMDEAPTGGPHYRARMAIIREVCESLGESVWRLTDATLERRLGRYPRMVELIRLAKEADRASVMPQKRSDPP